MMWEGLALTRSAFPMQVKAGEEKKNSSFVKTGMINRKGQGFNLDNTGSEMNQRTMTAFPSQALLCNYVCIIKV